jgi:23S rRNA pseudouridine1911/1915/1917 synthase
MPFVKEKYHIPSPTPAFLFVMAHFGYTQGQAQRLIGKGRLLINGISLANSGEVISGDIEMVYFSPESRARTALFQTPDFMVFEKPSGVLVHPNTMATEYSMLDEIRTIAGDHANAVHRIDMETSGLLLASKHKNAERFLKNGFEVKTIKKTYLAWVDGKLLEPFSVNVPLRKRNDYSQCKHKVTVAVAVEGKSAHTDFIPLKYNAELDATLVACYPITGRTHQIRVHLFHMKHPILGDPIYGTSFTASDAYLEGKITAKNRLVETGASRLMLHAHTLEFVYKARFLIESKIAFENEIGHICPKERRKFNQAKR